MSVSAGMTYIEPYTDATHEDDEGNGKVCMLCMLLWTRRVITIVPPPKSGGVRCHVPPCSPTHLHKIEKRGQYQRLRLCTLFLGLE